MIGVNSQNEDLGFLNKNSIVFKKYENIKDEYDNTTEKWSEPIILLGDLSSLKSDKISGYGLYAENVYLTGELSTGNSDNGYAGINTLHNVPANLNSGFFKKTGDSSTIVFWAGTSSNTPTNIASSSFFVTA
jgi:hypothetical protein